MSISRTVNERMDRMFSAPDTLERIVAELRECGRGNTYRESLNDWADRLEKLSAASVQVTDEDIRLFDGQWVNIVNAPGQTIEGAVKATEEKMRENITKGWPKLRLSPQGESHGR